MRDGADDDGVNRTTGKAFVIFFSFFFKNGVSPRLNEFSIDSSNKLVDGGCPGHQQLQNTGQEDIRPTQEGDYNIS